MQRLLYTSSLPEDYKKLHFDYNIDEVKGDTVIIELTIRNNETHQDVALSWLHLNKRNKTLQDVTTDPDKPAELTFDKELFERVLKYCDFRN